MTNRSGSEKRHLQRNMNIRTDDELYERIRYAAAKEGMSPISWARMVLAAAAGDKVQTLPQKQTPQPRPRRFRAAVDAPELAQFQAQLSKLGTNINQIAYRLHKEVPTGPDHKATLAKLIPAYNELKQMYQAIQRTLAGSDE